MKRDRRIRNLTCTQHRYETHKNNTEYYTNLKRKREENDIYIYYKYTEVGQCRSFPSER